MKQIGIRVLALILAGIMSFSALSCAKKETPSADTGNSAPAKTDATADHDGPSDPDAPTDKSGGTDPGEPTPGDASEEAVEPTEPEWPEPDYSDFVMPEETGELTVYGFDMINLLLSPALELFQEKYPDVKVNFVKMTDDEFEARVETEVPAGKGPDLLFCYAGTLPDPYKTMAAGLFEDLTPYLLNDPDFSFDDFLTGVMDFGKYRGQRQLIPVEVLLPLFKTSVENLADSGIDPDGIRTLEDFCAACMRYHENNPENALFSDGGDEDYLSDLIKISGMSFIDYDRQTPVVNEEMLHPLLDVCRAFDSENGRPVGKDYKQISGVIERMYLGSNLSNSSPMILINDMWIVSHAGETPCILPAKDISGGTTAEVVSYAAIPIASRNKLNAYRLLDILLSEEIQSGYTKTGWKAAYIRIGSPVRKSSFADHLYFTRDEMFPGDPDIDGYIQVILNFRDSVTSACILPSIIRRYLNLELMPYVRGEKTWDDCYKRFLSTLELYASE